MLTIRVVLGADSLLNQRAGIGRLTLEVARAIRQEPEVSGLLLWMGERLIGAESLSGFDTSDPSRSADATASELKRLRLLIGRLPGVQMLREQRDRIRMGRTFAELRHHGEGPLIYHETNMIPRRFVGTTVVHMHDLSWWHHPELHPRDRIAWIERNLARMLRQTARFVSVSEFTAAALTKEFGVPRSRIDVVASAASSVFRPYRSVAHDPVVATVLARHKLQDRSYVFSVSTLEPRKNFDRLVAAHLALPLSLRERFPLVIAGGSGWGTRLANEAALWSQGAGSLRLLGFVPDDELAILTARAAVFPYVSLYEGFGLPVLEAMKADTPVVASSTTATGETAGEAALLVDPMDVQDIARAIRVVLEDTVSAERLRRLGLARAATFSWQQTVGGLISCWKRALSETR